MNEKMLVVPGVLESLSPIREYVMSAANSVGLIKDKSYRLALAVDEIATNVITPGYEENGLSGDIAVGISPGDGELKVVLEDTGVPFDPCARELPSTDDLSIPLSDRQIGGLGIFLSIGGVDEFRYERNGEINRNIFVMKID